MVYSSESHEQIIGVVVCGFILSKHSQMLYNYWLLYLDTVQAQSLKIWKHWKKKQKKQKQTNVQLFSCFWANQFETQQVGTDGTHSSPIFVFVLII